MEVRGRCDREMLRYKPACFDPQVARDASARRSSEVKAEMMRALEGLEEFVRDGRAAMDRERSRQEEVCSLFSSLPSPILPSRPPPSPLCCIDTRVPRPLPPTELQ